jgi:hypothetical protein
MLFNRFEIGSQVWITAEMRVSCQDKKKQKDFSDMFLYYHKYALSYSIAFSVQ